MKPASQFLTDLCARADELLYTIKQDGVSFSFIDRYGIERLVYRLGHDYQIADHEMKDLLAKLK